MYLQQQYIKEQQRYFEISYCFKLCIENDNSIDAELIFKRMKKQNTIVNNLQLKIIALNN